MRQHRVRLLTCFLLACFSLLASGRKGALVFSDEFRGETLDSAKWSPAPRGKAMWSRWIGDSPDVVFVRGGKLVCRAVPRLDRRPDSVPMLTGAVWTRGKFTLKYGRVEVRMRTNLLPGNFPAAWMTRTWGNGPAAPYAEIDIAEMVGGDGLARHAWHTQHTIDTPRHGLKNSYSTTVDTSRWHVYAVEWTPDHIIWLVDGKERARHERPARAVAGELAREWTFDSPCHLLLNQSVMHGAHGIEARLSETYETEFDWVRVYAWE